MNKKELIAAISNKCGVKKADADKVLEAFAEIVTEELKNGSKVVVAGFGTFEVSERAERKGRNPKSGEEMVIPASKSPKFKPGKPLKDAINE